MRVVAVAVPVPQLEALTYSVPDHLPMPAVGARVRVPLGSRALTGCVVSHPSGAPPSSVGDLKDVAAIVDAEPLLPASVVSLCQWVADYYMAGVGDAIAAALPPGTAGRASAFKTRRVAVVTVQGLSVLGSPTSDLTTKQRAGL